MDSENNFSQTVSQYRLPLALGLIGLVLLAGGVISSGIISKTFKNNPLIKSTKQPIGDNTQTSSLKVDVSGAVSKPGVYTLNSGARIEEALKMAGGVTEDADTTFLSKSINLAQKVSDGMKIYIPRSGESKTTASEVAGLSTSESQAELINVNSASATELDKLPGVGATVAQTIISKRPYSSIEELFTKKAVNKATYEKIKSLVSVY
jgi:competence protein ComEA